MECGGVDEWSSDTSQVDRPTNAQMICRLVKSTNHCDLYPKIEVVRVPKTVYKTYVGAILSPKNSPTKAQYLHFRCLKMVDFFVFFPWSLGRRAASSEGESHLAVFFQEKSGDVVTLVSKLCHSWQTIDRASFIFTGVMDNGDKKRSGHLFFWNYNFDNFVAIFWCGLPNFGLCVISNDPCWIQPAAVTSRMLLLVGWRLVRETRSPTVFNVTCLFFEKGSKLKMQAYIFLQKIKPMHPTCTYINFCFFLQICKKITLTVYIPRGDSKAFSTLKRILWSCWICGE